jgi:hypothetical protein
MPACQLTTSDVLGRPTIALSGTFDGSAAWELAGLVSRGGGELALDFSRVNAFYDHGFAVLAQALHRQGRGVQLLGLRRHQLRLLAYLGVLLDESGAVEPTAQCETR